MTTQFNALRVQSNVSGPGIKERIPVKTISTTNQNLAINLVGAVINGYTLTTGDRFILAAQTTATENGVYVADTISRRSEDYELGDSSQCFMVVTAGTFANTMWRATANGIIGISTQDFKQTDTAAYTTGDIVYAGTSTSLALLNKPLSTSYLSMTNVGVPSWQSTIAVANGGTGRTSLNSNNLIIGNGTSPVNFLAPLSYKCVVTDNTPSYTLSNDVHLSSIQGATTTNNLVIFTDTVSAVNYYGVTNSISGVGPTFNVNGTDTNVSMNLQIKGTGTYNMLGSITSSAEVRLFESNGTDYIGLKSPASLTGPTTFTLPSTDGSNGQFLRTNGTGTLSFSGISRDVSLCANPIIVSNLTTAVSVAVFAYNIARYGASASCILYFESVVGVAFNVVITNVTTSSAISTTTVSTSGFQSIAFTAPAANARLSFDVVKNSSGTSPTIYGLQLAIA